MASKKPYQNRYVSGPDQGDHSPGEDYRVPSASGGYERWATHADVQERNHAPLATGSSLINVGNNERIASAIGGTAMLVWGLAKPSIGRLLVAAAGGALLFRGATGFCSVNAAIGRNTAEISEQTVPVEIQHSVTVSKPRAEVYAFWRKLENLPKFMQHLAEVRQLDEKRSHWVAKVPKGLGRLSWDAVIVDEQENKRLAWQSLPSALVDNAGEVTFSDSATGNGTDVHVRIHYRPPVGAAGSVIARLLNPVFSDLVKDDIRSFKRVVENDTQSAASSDDSQSHQQTGKTTQTLSS